MYLEEPTIITSQKWDKDITPLVSVSCTTYNHEQYICEAIEGFLMQKTTFPVEIIIHDDASTDKTAGIVKEYAEKFPCLIVPILQKENQYSKKQGSISVRLVWPHVRGKYIAPCEGDDYWTDPYKLQKQVDFLEANPDYSMCFHNYLISVVNKLMLKKQSYKEDVTVKDYAKNMSGIHTATVLFRSCLYSVITTSTTEKVTGSYYFFIKLCELGKIRFINEPMAIYRVHEGGVWSGKSVYEQGLMSLQNKEAMIINFYQNREVKSILKDTYVKSALRYSLISLVNRKFSQSFEFVKISLRYGVNHLHYYYWVIFFFDMLFSKIVRRA